jgi:hypothetical protein
MAVPEATVNPDNLAAAWESDVGATGKFLVLKAIPVTQSC